jgi:ubiquinone/menaquinone biosynthesis C-methylase UbiE
MYSIRPSILSKLSILWSSSAIAGSGPGMFWTRSSCGRGTWWPISVAAAGYFTLKISPMIGATGQILAVDIRRLSLSFLWMRAILRKPHTVHLTVGEPDDPHLPSGTVDAVLIANTYHEFHDPNVMIEHTFRSLRSGGRLVIVDRGPRSDESEQLRDFPHGHDISVNAVEERLRQNGFEIIRRVDPFIDRPGDDPWWLLAARRP